MLSIPGKRRFSGPEDPFEKIAAEYSNVGLDYKIENYIKEAKAGVDEEEKEKLREDEAKKSKEQDSLNCSHHT